MKQATPGEDELDRVFEVLSHANRRKVLQRLTEVQPHDEIDLSPEDVAPEQGDLDTLKVELYHNHLPKLEDKGYIRWNRDGMTIQRGPRFEEIASVLELMDTHRDELPASLT